MVREFHAATRNPAFVSRTMQPVARSPRAPSPTTRLPRIGDNETSPVTLETTLSKTLGTEKHQVRGEFAALFTRREEGRPVGLVEKHDPEDAAPLSPRGGLSTRPGASSRWEFRGRSR